MTDTNTQKILLTDEEVRMLADIAVWFNVSLDGALHIAIDITQQALLKYEMDGNSDLIPTGLLNAEEDNA